MSDIHVPFGLCEVTYGDIKLPVQAEEAVFEAKPEYEKITGGALNRTLRYLLKSYDVTFDINMDKENHDILKMHYPVLQDFYDGMVDNPKSVDMSGDRLTIHPLGVDTNEYDITLFNAYIEPTSFKRTYKKETDSFSIRFVGKPVKLNKQLNHSYFFIGHMNEGAKLWS